MTLQGMAGAKRRAPNAGWTRRVAAAAISREIAVELLQLAALARAAGFGRAESGPGEKGSARGNSAQKPLATSLEETTRSASAQ